MARSIKPESAASKILKKVADGTAKDAAEAVRQDPSLEPGLRLIQQAVGGAPSGASSSPPRAQRAGSGSARLSRD